MAIISVSEVENWKSVGWYDYFPYCGKEVWITAFYFYGDTTDIYGTRHTISVNNMNMWNKITIEWYDDSAWTQINQNEKSLSTLIFNFNGGKYKMPLFLNSDYLRNSSLWLATV